MTLYKDRYRAETTRLKGWDYDSAGYYFVTICTYERLCLLGDINNGKMRLSPAGEIVSEEWRKTGELRKNVVLDEWVIMPNHVHAIIAITDEAPPGHANGNERRANGGVSTVTTMEPPSVETRRWRVSDGDAIHHGVTPGMKPKSLGAIINQFKSVCTKRIRAAGHDFGWQARYYDHIIRDEKSLDDIRAYIVNNPLKWELDKNNPVNIRLTAK
jgi:putative transposase